ncbi:MAG: SHOCT domain-containing protein [Frankiaceae bacterium]
MSHTGSLDPEEATMMTLFGTHMGVAGWLAMTVTWFVIIGVIVWVVFRVLPDSPQQPETPRQILDRRLAAGELDLATYDRLKARLAEPDVSAHDLATYR